MSKFSYRPATLEDSQRLVEYIQMAGDGIYEFLLEDILPPFTSEQILVWAVAIADSPLNFRNCAVAVEERSGEIVGAINMWPTDKYVQLDSSILDSERWRYLKPVTSQLIADSMFINALAVAEKWRRQGIASGLLGVAVGYCTERQIDSLSLQVWSDNIDAQKFYRKQGFAVISRQELPPHPQLPGKTCSILMQRRIKG